MSMTLSAAHFAYLAAMTPAERRPLIARMTTAEKQAYSRYLANVAYLYADEVPTGDAATEAAQAAAEAFDADYDAYLDGLPA